MTPEKEKALVERLEKGNIQLLGDDDAEFLFSLAHKGLALEARIAELEEALKSLIINQFECTRLPGTTGPDCPEFYQLLYGWVGKQFWCSTCKAKALLTKGEERG